MTEKELEKLGRTELTELLLSQMEENEKLRNEQKQRSDEEGTLETHQIGTEPARKSSRSRFLKNLRKTVCILIVTAAVAVLFSTLCFPVFRIYGNSMNPSLKAGNIAVAVRSGTFEQGDVIAFYYNNKILVKRVIACSGDWVDLDAQGNVYVNGELLEEPYVQEKSLGQCDIELPYQVPEGRLFVCGDHRSTSVDSRSSSVGCVAEEQIAGKIVFKVWPLSELGGV